MLRSSISAVALVAVLSVPSSAQDAPDTLSVAARLVMRQPPGVRVRVLADNAQHVGLVERTERGLLYLTDPPGTVALRSIDDAWLQRRSTGRGAKVGAIVGGSAGAVLFSFGALVLSSVDSEIDGAGDIALAGAMGAALGAGSGFLVGALIGSGISRWERITESSAPPVIAAGAGADRSGFSSFNVTPVVTSAAENGAGPAFGASVSYLPQLSRFFALGPEVGIYSLDYTPPPAVPCDPAIYCPPPTEIGDAWAVAGLARIGPVTGTGAQPYALLGLGLYRFAYGDVLGGYSAGGGIRWNVGSSYAVGVEGRWHSNATNPASDENLGFITAGVGLTLRH